MTPSESLIDSVCTPNPVPENIKEGQLWATHSGTLKLDDFELKCHILNNGERVFDADDVQRYFANVPHEENILVKEAMEQQESAYTNLFMFFQQEHNLILIHSQMDDIIHAVDQFKIEFNK